VDNFKIKYNLDRSLNEIENRALNIVSLLQDKGFETYFAGGAVRDMLLNQKIHDVDIATAAKPEEIEKLFPGCESRGKSFGVMVIKAGDLEFEVATFRTDIGTTDHRRPEKVEFSSAKEDAKRRDFTVNGLFFDPVKNELLDYVGGLKDLQGKTIRLIGDAQVRIEEDYLRLIRAVRFAAKLKFEIEKETFENIFQNADKITSVSKERLRDELSKILLDESRQEGLKLLAKTGLLKVLLPELEETKNVAQPPEFHSEGDVWTHTLLALKNINNQLRQLADGGPTEELVWAVLLHDIGKPETRGFRSTIGKANITFFDHDVRSAEKAKEILSRLRFSHTFVSKVVWAISQHMRIVNAFRGMSERKQKKLFSDENIQLLIDLTFSDLSASLRPNGYPEMDLYEDAVALKEKFAKEMLAEEKNQMKKFDLITGEDIMELLKISRGPEVGKIKNKIEKAYLDGLINSRSEALQMIEDLKKEA